jgi:tetratricopeptide (TPR) repeat protein
MLNTTPSSSDLSGEIGRVQGNESCNTWTESSIHSPTVSAKRLAVPGKATSEFQKGCSAFKAKKFLEAEDHLRRAVDLYQDYSAAWVVLGQVLDEQKKQDDAHVACWKAREVDPTYVAAYLCLADFAANDSDWNQVLDLANRALSIDPTGNPYAFYYAAAAGLHLKQVAQAEVYSQAALKLDEWHHMPQLHLLLAQVYDAMGNAQGAIAQLREFLRVAPNSKDAAAAKTLLADVEARPAK